MRRCMTMLLTEIIKNSTTAINARRITLENKQNAELYAKALIQLCQQDYAIKSLLDCADEMKSKGIVDKSVLPKSVRDDLLNSVGDCGSAISEGTLTLDTVKVLQTKSENYASQLRLIWKDAAVKYAEGTKGYLSIIGGLTQDPKKARELGDNITKTVEGALSINAINKLVTDVGEAKAITDSFSLNPAIEAFLKKVSSAQATVTDLTPEIMQWLKEKQLLSKLKVKFM